MSETTKIKLMSITKEEVQKAREQYTQYLLKHQTEFLYSFYGSIIKGNKDVSQLIADTSLAIEIGELLTPDRDKITAVTQGFLTGILLCSCLYENIKSKTTKLDIFKISVN
jgi:hypothetical protein